MSESAGGSPNLTLKVSAPTAIAEFRAMAAAANELKAALAGVQMAGKGTAVGGGSGVTKLKAEVAELKAALVASQMEVTKLAAAVETQSKMNVQAIARETAAVRAKAAEEKKAAAEVASAKKKADADAAASAKYLHDLKLGSAKMTGTLALTELAVRERAAAQAAKTAEQAEAYRIKVMTNSALMTVKAQETARQATERAAERTRILQERELVRAQIVEERAAKASELRAQRVAAAKEAAALKAAATQEAAATRAAAAASRAAAVEIAAAERAAAANGVGRSALRGVTAAGGGTFLTYGQSIPALVTAYAGAQVVKQTVQKGSEFGYQTAFSGALSSMSPERLAETRAELMKLGTDSVYGPVELAKGLRVLEQAGVGASDAIKVLPVSMRMALQGETDMTHASETLVSVMRQFKLGISDIPKIGDTISKTASVTQASVGSVMESLKNFVGISDRYNVSLNTTLSIVGLLAQQGIKNGPAGTFARRFVEELYTPRSDNARRAMDEIGFSAYDKKTGAIKPADDAVKDFVGRLQGYDIQSRNSLLAKIFDERAVKTASILVNDLAKEFDKLRGKIDDSGGALDRFYKAMTPTTKLLWEQVKSNFEGSVIESFKVIEPPLQRALGQLKDFFKSPEVKGFLQLLMMIPSGYVQLAGAVASTIPSAQANRDTRISHLNFGITRAQEQGVTVDTAGHRGEGLRKALAERNALMEVNARQGALASPDPALAAENARLMGKAAVMGRSGTETEFGSKRASQRILDPLAAKEALQMSQAEDRESVADWARVTARINQQASEAQRLADARHRAGLISETQYNAEIEQINEHRSLNEIAIANEQIAELKSRERQKWTEAQREDSRRKQADIAAKRDAIVRETQFNVDLRKIKGDGEIRAVELEAASVLAKHRRDEELRVEGRELDTAIRLSPVDVAAQYKAEFDARKRFESDLQKVDADIAKAGGPGRKLDELKKYRQALLDARDAAAQLQGVEARNDVQHQSSFSFGWNEAFHQYQQNATNAAQQARDAFTASANAMSGAIEEFAKTGKLSIRSFASTFIDAMIKIHAAKASAGIMGMVNLGAIGKFLGLGTANVTNGAFGAPVVGGPAFHTGGIVGIEGGAFRPGVFAGAPRFHGGGMVGDEVPIIAKHGEGVFTQKQMAALAPAGNGAPAINITQNVTIDARGADSGVEQRIAAAMQATKEQTKAEIIRSMTHNGAFARR